MAASLACGYLGMIEGLQPTDPIAGSAHDLPSDCRAPWMRRCVSSGPASRWWDLLGPTFVEAFALVKEAEYEVFLQVISSWEREHLLLNV